MLTSGERPGSVTGELVAVVLLGYHAVKSGLQAGPYRRYGVLGAEERDGVFELAAVVAELECGQCVQGMLRRIYCRGLLRCCGGWHWLAVLMRVCGGVMSLPIVLVRA